MADVGKLCFEQPLNERIRTFLRLEHLIQRLRHHQPDESLWGRRATMSVLLDILNIMSRHDIRGEVSKELAQRHAGLKRLVDREDIDHNRLDRFLEQLDSLGQEMNALPPQFASYQLRDNELLNNLNNRSAIPGGTCSFDLPSYQHWLLQAPAIIDADIQRWSARIAPFEKAIGLLLNLLRDSADAVPVQAPDGVLVHNTETGTQLIRVLLDDAAVFPEISAGRHRATIRFMTCHDTQMRMRQAQGAIDFHLACCRF